MRKTVVNSFLFVFTIFMLFTWVPFATAQEPVTPDIINSNELSQSIVVDKKEIEGEKEEEPKEPGATVTGEKEGEAAAGAPKELGTTIRAEKIVNNGKAGISHAYGKVFIQKGTKSVWGDTATYNLNTGDVNIQGDVHYIDEGVEIFCEVADLNFERDEGSLYNARLNIKDEYFVNGEKIIKKGKDQYIVENGGVTSCPQEEPHWKFNASKLDLTLDDYARMKHLVFRAGGLPILYMPYWVAPAKTKRATGFLAPTIGYSDRNGAQFNNAFFWAISDNSDLTVSHQYMGRKGNLVGSELRYIFSKRTRGNLYTKYLQETDTEKDVNRDLWKLIYDHDQALPLGIDGVVHLDLESEDSIDREYGTNLTNRTRRYTDSYMTLNKTWTNRILTVIARQQISTLPTKEDDVAQVPSIVFTNQQEQIWESPFYAGLDSSFTSFKTKTVRDGVTYPYDVDRMDFFPTVSMPITMAPWLSLTPELGYRYTTYTNGIDNVNGGLLNESFAREYYTASVELKGPRFYKIFENDSPTRPKTKHLITPTITWKFLPDYSFDGEDRQKVSPLDSVDKGSPKNTVGFSLLNQVFVKEIKDEDSSQTIDIVFLNISQKYDLNEASRDKNPETEKKPLKALVFDLDTKIVPWLLLNYYTTYSHYDKKWNKSNLELAFVYEEIFYISMERNYRWGGDGEGAKDSIWDTFYVDLSLGKGFSMDYSLNYDEFNGETNNSVLRMQYKDDCWSTTISWFERKINVNNGANGESVEMESGFLFSINLLGVGDVFGKEKKPLYGRRI